MGLGVRQSRRRAARALQQNRAMEPLVHALTQPEARGRTPAYDPDFDPTITDPDKYVTVLENDMVRVLRYRDEAGARTHPHSHPSSVLYALSAFRRLITFANGTSREHEFKPGDVMWLPPQTHIGENTGTSATDLLLVELKNR